MDSFKLENVEEIEGAKRFKAVNTPREGKHPLLEDFLLQYSGCWEEAAERAFLVYQDLTEVRGWWFTQMSFNEELERPYIVGQERRNGNQQLVLPLGMDEQLSTRDLQAFLASKFNMVFTSEIILAVSDLDSTLVYYKLNSGLNPPEAPDIVNAKRHQRVAAATVKRQHIADCVQKAMKRLNKEDT